ncbi:hypothetical protein MNB_SUP05-SYMBIONT-7-712 [hydrothermal vent metagenome]|uniref:Uncharacterized protein n=1 Tax=hydrothermal vent metagenome TaxID=652676 RepID=A0A1W1E3H2_9ZZZZ
MGVTITILKQTRVSAFVLLFFKNGISWLLGLVRGRGFI